MPDAPSPLAERQAVFRAIRADDLAALRAMHARRVSMNVPTLFAGKTQTPFEFAQREGRDAVVKLFVELGIVTATSIESAQKTGAKAKKTKSQSRGRSGRRCHSSRRYRETRRASPESWHGDRADRERGCRRSDGRTDW